MEKGLYILGNVVGGCMRDSHVNSGACASLLGNHKGLHGGVKMTKLVMTMQLCFFIAYGTLSGIVWREWAEAKYRQAEVDILISLPLSALTEIKVSDI